MWGRKRLEKESSMASMTCSMARELPKGSSKICQYPFADRDVGLISAVTVVDEGKGYRRKFRGGLITQREMRAMRSSPTGPTSRGRK